MEILDFLSLLGYNHDDVTIRHGTISHNQWEENPWESFASSSCMNSLGTSPKLFGNFHIIFVQFQVDVIVDANVS